MSGWVWLISGVNDIPHRVPDDPDVIAGFVGRDYVLTDIPGELDSDTEEFAVAFEEWQAATNEVSAEEPPAEVLAGEPPAELEATDTAELATENKKEDLNG